MNGYKKFKRSKLNEEYERIGVAYHEAAHAIIGLINFIKITKIYIYHDNDTFEGKAEPENIHTWLPEHHQLQKTKFQKKILEQEIMFRYAGRCADKIFYKQI